MSVPFATGASVTAKQLKKEKMYRITEFGAVSGGDPAANTEAVNRAVLAASEGAGGTVVIPAGEYKVYTIRLKSHVNLYLEKGSVLRAAKTDILHSYEKQTGEGGNYDEPEVNLYAGLQDHGHTYFSNSLICGMDLTDIMIYGPGVIDGSCFEEEYREYVLMGGDPMEPDKRNEPGHRGEWFGNKAIALVRCKNVVLKEFSLVIGGHFAILATALTNFLVEDLLVDTTRDGLDVDCCQDVTVRRSTFNSLTDDALVMKGSFGAGFYQPVKNVLIEDCVVSGYDAGSVYAGLYTREKLIATDRCGPTGRVKLGTESTCGYERVTVRRVTFDRSRGFALEAVDGSDLCDILFTDCTMNNVSSSPIYIRAGERGRFPVTGISQEEWLVAKEPNVRMDNRNWVLPDAPGYKRWPAKRYTPSYRKNKSVCIDGHSSFSIVDQTEPAAINPVNVTEENGRYYARRYDEEAGAYVTDYDKELEKWQLPCYANGSGADHMARVHNIEISNVKITNADPRYPILLMGLADSRIENVIMKNISVEFRGGITMQQAVEQRQLNTNWRFTQYGTKPSVQTLPWLVNTFFLKEEGLLPRVDWDPKAECWKDDPYNVPELPHVYPEPSNWGILPAYGMYARHVDGLLMENVEFTWKTEDGRHAVVLDDAYGVKLKNIRADVKDGVEPAAAVTSHFRRPTNHEYILNEPYVTTTVEASFPEGWEVKRVEIEAPAPGTPNDGQYVYPTVPVPENGYHFGVATEAYPLPLTVFRPFFAMPARVDAAACTEIRIPVVVRHPAVDVTEEETSGFIYNESVSKKDFTVKGCSLNLKTGVEDLPEGAHYEEESGEIVWIPKAEQYGEYKLHLWTDDGVMKEYGSLTIAVSARQDI